MMRMLQKKYIGIVLLLLVAVSASAQKAERDYIRKGNRFFKDSVYVDAEVNYRKALEVNPKSTVSMFNLGNTLTQQNKLQEAMEQYVGATKIEKDKSNLAQIYHNMGVIFHSQKDYAKAVEAYKESLRNNPKDDETRYNLALAQKQLQDQQQNQDQNQDQDKQDQQKEQDKQQDQQKDQQQNQDQQQQPSQPEEFDGDRSITCIFNAYVNDMYDYLPSSMDEWKLYILDPDMKGYSYRMNPAQLFVYVAGDTPSAIQQIGTTEQCRFYGDQGELVVVADRTGVVPVYGVDGRKVCEVNAVGGSTVRVPLKAGVYIVKGHKVVVR